MTFGFAPSRDAAPPPGMMARMPTLMANARRLRAAGVNMIAGTDAGIAPRSRPTSSAGPPEQFRSSA